jgi:hypothetical protein
MIELTGSGKPELASSCRSEWQARSSEHGSNGCNDIHQKNVQSHVLDMRAETVRDRHQQADRQHAPALQTAPADCAVNRMLFPVLPGPDSTQSRGFSSEDKVTLVGGARVEAGRACEDVHLRGQSQVASARWVILPPTHAHPFNFHQI